jgi:hypothetical protein
VHAPPQHSRRPPDADADGAPHAPELARHASPFILRLAMTDAMNRPPLSAGLGFARAA